MLTCLNNNKLIVPTYEPSTGNKCCVFILLKRFNFTLMEADIFVYTLSSAADESPVSTTQASCADADKELSKLL